MDSPRCRFCRTLLEHSFIDLGVSPLANSYLKKEQLQQMEPFYPLHAYVCDSCFLVQLPEVQSSEDIFSAFREMADATGGFVDSSANPASSFKRAVEASENYYLLYYSPDDYQKDGLFKEIKVRVKEKDFKVTHRMGYFSN